MRVILHGLPQSSYVWTARAALNLAGIEYEFAPMEMGSHKAPDHRARHPFGRVPTLTVDGKTLFETAAILSWANHAGNGALCPTDGFEAAQVQQWISVVNCYLYRPIVSDYILEYVFSGKGGPNRTVIDPTVPLIKERLDHLEAALGDDSPWIVGNAVSAADLLMGPLLIGLAIFPEGKRMMAGLPRCARLVRALMAMPAFTAAAPPTEPRGTADGATADTPGSNRSRRLRA